MKRIFILSGPAGAGKSTVSRKLAEGLCQSAYIEGDMINHMVVGGYIPPWQSNETLSLVWKNIADLSANFLHAGKNVIIDYVAFPENVMVLFEKLKSKEHDIDVRYIVLWTDEKELLRRDALRPKQEQMGERCLELMEEFQNKQIEERFFFHTPNTQFSDWDRIVMEIKTNDRFIYRGASKRE